MRESHAIILKAFWKGTHYYLFCGACDKPIRIDSRGRRYHKAGRIANDTKGITT